VIVLHTTVVLTSPVVTTGITVLILMF
jgi:hypothetical protein